MRSEYCTGLARIASSSTDITHHNQHHMKDIFTSKRSANIFVALASIFIVLIIFWAGMRVGYKQAHFREQWGANYIRNSHGAFGQIISIDLPALVIKGRSEAEKTVLVGTSTAVMSFRDKASVSDLKVGDAVVVIGTPDGQGRITASLIRIAPRMNDTSK